MDTLSPAVTLPRLVCPTPLSRSLYTKSPWRNMSYTETILPMEKEDVGITSQSLMQKLWICCSV